MTTPTATNADTDRPHGDLPAAMQAAVAREYGTHDVIAVEEIPVPTPEKGEVLVAVEASSLNALDWHFLTGTPYLIRPSNGIRSPKRIVLGADVAGTVVALGEGVTGHAVGDEVFGECLGGGCGGYLAVSENHVATKPPSVSWVDAGATGVAALTALQGLRTHAAVQQGDRVLINGAAGGVGTFAVQIAKALGARVTAVCSTRNVEMVRAIGADEVIDYSVADFVDGGVRFDVMFDNVGNRTPAECLSVLKDDARYVLITGPKENRWFGPVGHIIRSAWAFWRADPSFHQFTASANPEDLTILGEYLADGSVRPRIDRVIGLEDVAAAMAEIGTGHTRAKIAVNPLA